MLRNKSTLSLGRIWTSPDTVSPPLTTAKSLLYRAHGMLFQLYDTNLMMSSKRSEEEKWAEALSASEEVVVLTILQIRGAEGDSAMSPSTKGQFRVSISSSWWKSCQRTHVSAASAIVSQLFKQKMRLVACHAADVTGDYTGTYGSRITDVHEPPDPINHVCFLTDK